MVLFSVTLSHKGDKKLNKSNKTMQTYAMIFNVKWGASCCISLRHKNWECCQHEDYEKELSCTPTHIKDWSCCGVTHWIVKPRYETSSWARSASSSWCFESRWDQREVELSWGYHTLIGFLFYSVWPETTDWGHKVVRKVSRAGFTWISLEPGFFYGRTKESPLCWSL